MMCQTSRSLSRSYRCLINPKVSSNLLPIGLGMTGVIDETGHLMGVFTDGDLRRTIDSKVDIHSTRIGDVMTADCRTAQPKMLAAEAVHIMDSYKITALPVTDADNRLVGALNVHDLLRAGVM